MPGGRTLPGSEAGDLGQGTSVAIERDRKQQEDMEGVCSFHYCDAVNYHDIIHIMLGKVCGWAGFRERAQLQACLWDMESPHEQNLTLDNSSAKWLPPKRKHQNQNRSKIGYCLSASLSSAGLGVLGSFHRLSPKRGHQELTERGNQVEQQLKAHDHGAKMWRPNSATKHQNRSRPH